MLLWAALLLLLLVAQTLLVVLTVRHEASRVQDQVEDLAHNMAAALRSRLLHNLQDLQALQANLPSPEQWQHDALQLLRQERDMLQVERRNTSMQVTQLVASPFRPPLFRHITRPQIEFETGAACAAALRTAAPVFSRSYFVPQSDGSGAEVIDLCVPVQAHGRDAGFQVATIELGTLLAQALSAQKIHGHEVAFVEADGARLARAGAARGAGVYTAQRVFDLPGHSLQLRVDSAAGHPSLIPNLATALVLGLSLALFVLVLLLVRDVRRRASTEAALAEALAFRQAMEDSLITGLRARDLNGRIRYVNPAFCAMVGFSEEELREATQPPYWPPEHAALYGQRQLGTASAAKAPASREGFETLFMRNSGERFAVMIYEAPLVDGDGRHTGWMGAVLDVSAQRRVEALARQQQERLQASARLATIGEMASLLSHELNQPLSAIASYASGSMNLLEDTQPLPREELQHALQRIGEQAERAGRVIRSVQTFVRRRESVHEAVAVELLVDSVLPLIRLQAQKGGTQVVTDLPEQPVRVMCDRTMVEQVLLNLARNAIQAMDSMADTAPRRLCIRVRHKHARWVSFSVGDSGPGISTEVAARLFTPFFTTRVEGMGLGLSLCRTVIEQHGGALDFVSPAPGLPAGTEFTFTLPAAAAPVAVQQLTATPSSTP